MRRLQCLSVFVARRVGSIGYMIQNALHNELLRANLDPEVVTMITEVEVDPEDPAFKNPTKPIGPYFSKKEVKKLEQEGKNMKESEKGWREVVPSPRPIKPLQTKAIKSLVDDGTLVISSAGGGVPVVKKKNGTFEGVNGVIDKDLTAKCLGVELDADVLLILTDVDNVYKDYQDKDKKTPLETLTVEEAKKLVKSGEFAEGSMLPKIEACIEFVEKTSKRAIITSIEKAVRALTGEAGTHIVP